MRILIANYEFPPIGGGASKVSFELARTLVRLGHEVVVLTASSRDTVKVESIDGVTVYRVWSWRIGPHDAGLRGALTYVLAALPELRRLLKTGSFDVVHYFFGLPTGILSLYSYFVAKTPYIVSLRGSDVPLYDLDSRKLVLLHRVTRPLTHLIWRHAARVFAVSRGLRDLAVASFPDVPVDVIYNGVDVPQEGLLPDPASARKRLHIVCVSRLIPRKGISDLLNALASLSDIDFELRLVGSGPSEQALREHAEAIGIAQRVKMLGYCSPEEVMEQYYEADIFVLPTHSDAFANVILEAMSMALPVIACRVVGVAEAVVDGETGILVNPKSPQELADAIRRLAVSKDMRLAFGRAGQQRVRDFFSWKINAEQHIAAFQAAAASPTTSAE